MKTNGRSLTALVIVLLACATAAHAQESRAEMLRQEREDKQKTVAPYDANVLEKGLTFVETGSIPLLTRDGLYAKLGSLTTGSGFAYGAGYRTSRLFRREGTLDVWMGATAKGYWATEGRVRFPNLAAGRLLVEGYGRRHEYPQEDYFGLGPLSLRRNQTDYSLIANTMGGRMAVRPARVVMVGGGLEYLHPTVGNGSDQSLPSIGETFDDRTAPGLSRQPDFLRTSAFVDVDWRRPRNARNGGWYRAELSHYSDRDLGAFSFNRLDVDVRQFVSCLSERRVFVGRVFASTSDHATGQEVPFYLMPTLGGNDSLRGFRDYRFRGPHALLLQGEYRFEIWSGLDAAVFYDAGKVAMRRSHLDLHNLETNYGFGFRFNTDNGVVLRVDTALGSRDGKHLWIVFGGTF
jgi:hypothetical protein